MLYVFINSFFSVTHIFICDVYRAKYIREYDIFKKTKLIYNFNTRVI